MEGTMYSILLFSGLFSLSSSLLHQHYFFNISKTWHGAQSYCRERCHDLSTMDSMEEMQRVLNITENNYDDAVWIGCKPNSKKQLHWSLAGRDFYKEGERTWILPLVSGVYSCLTYKEGTFHRRKCDKNIPSVCFDAKKEGELRYVLTENLPGWMVARDFCRTNYTDLASVRNAEEGQIIAKVAGELLVYIGLFRDGWTWSDGSDSSFRYWHPNKGHNPTSNQNCVAMLKDEDGKWGERPCIEEHPFVCKCPSPMRKFKVAVSSKSPGLDLNDPAVLDSILKHVRNDMKTALADDNFQLQWTKQPDGEVFAMIN